MKPKAPTSGYVDGAWWPRSRDLSIELPALLAALTGRLGPIERVVYNLNSWAAAPRRVDVDGNAVRLAGFRTQNADTVDLVAGSHRRVATLLVVPPECDSAVAEWAFDDRETGWQAYRQAAAAA